MGFFGLNGLIARTWHVVVARCVPRKPRKPHLQLLWPLASVLHIHIPDTEDTAPARRPPPTPTADRRVRTPAAGGRRTGFPLPSLAQKTKQNGVFTSC
jgi:hypothetical protein